ncbi:MAG: biopolymer transporter ExbD [Proteobacteria bacterium]|nr:biopolymer transporter ExbD [Pseudomonadota bacterium]
MSFSVNHKSTKKRRIISEINVTPFVDVLLVLLIIFMVAAPMMTSSVNIDLPKGSSSPNNEKIQPITVSIKSDGTIFLQEDLVKLSVLGNKLVGLSGGNLNNKILVRADKKLDYGRVMEVVSTISVAGFNQVVLVTELAQ